MALEKLFIISIQRSGSNWLHRCLGQHKEISINGELHISPALLAISQINTGDTVAQHKLKAAKAFKKAAANYVVSLMEANTDIKPNTKILADKSAYPGTISLKRYPEQTKYANVLEEYFPGAKKILLIRDARDVVVSFSEWKAQPLGSLLDLTPKSLFFFIRHLYNWCVLHEKWLDDIEGSDSWLLINYQEMKEHFIDVLEKTFKFLGLETDKDFIDRLERDFYKINSQAYAKENKDRGYGFFRKGEIGEWEEKFSWLHKLIYNIFFRSRVNKIYERATELNKNPVKT